MPQTRIIKQAYEKLLYLDSQGKHNWATNIKQLLFTNGFGIVWLFHTVGCKKSFLNNLKTRLIHAFEVDLKDRLMNYGHNNFYLVSQKEQVRPNILPFSYKSSYILEMFRTYLSSYGTTYV